MFFHRLVGPHYFVVKECLKVFKMCHNSTVYKETKVIYKYILESLFENKVSSSVVSQLVEVVRYYPEIQNIIEFIDFYASEDVAYMSWNLHRESLFTLYEFSRGKLVAFDNTFELITQKSLSISH